jgi:hypothetical protein
MSQFVRNVLVVDGAPGHGQPDREADEQVAADGGAVLHINTGGWNTLTTRKAIGEALHLALGARGLGGDAGVTYPKRKGSLPQMLRIFRCNPFEALASVQFTNRAVVTILPNGEVTATAN